MMNRYRKIEKTVGVGVEMCGDGAYGEVYKALDLHTNKHVALKRLKSNADDKGIPANALREFTLLKALQTVGHPNIVNLENVLLENSRIYLAFELMDGDLKKQMNALPAPHALSPALTQAYCKQVLSALAFIHSRGIMHRDLKPQNLLVSRSSTEACGFIIKIADFGLAHTFTPNPRPLSMEVVTRWYRPPEILMGSPLYSCAVDMWSIACILAEMSTGHALFESCCDIDQLHRIFCLRGTPTEETWPEFTSLPYYRNSFPQWSKLALQRVVPKLPALGVDFIENIFLYQSNKRMTAVEALSHPYLKLLLYRHDEEGGLIDTGANAVECSRVDSHVENQDQCSNDNNVQESRRVGGSNGDLGLENDPHLSTSAQFPFSCALMKRSRSFNINMDNKMDATASTAGEGDDNSEQNANKRKRNGSGESMKKDIYRIGHIDDDRANCDNDIIPHQGISALGDVPLCDTSIRRRRNLGSCGTNADESRRPPLPRRRQNASSSATGHHL